MIAKTFVDFFNSKLTQNLKNKKQTKIYIYPNYNGLGLALFIFFNFLIAVFYENNFGLLLSIIIFFTFFISIFISHQNLNNLYINENAEYFIESEKNENIDIIIVNSSNDKKLNIEEMASAKNVNYEQVLKDLETIIYSGTKLNLKYIIDDLFDEDSQDELMDFFNELESDEIQLILDEFKDEYEEDDLKLFRLYHYCKIAF